jgi:DNA-binding HxlR family transcriptional regulator
MMRFDPWRRSRTERARDVLEGLVDIGGRCLYQTLAARVRMSEIQLRQSLEYLNAHGYIGCRIRIDRKVVYYVTELGMNVVDLLQDLEA